MLCDRLPHCSCRQAGPGLNGLVSMTTNGNGSASKQTIYFYGYPSGWVQATANGPGIS